jgi:hypothetical protein
MTVPVLNEVHPYAGFDRRSVFISVYPELRNTVICDNWEILTLANERTTVAMKCPATFVSRMRPVTKEWSFFSAD